MRGKNEKKGSGAGMKVACGFAQFNRERVWTTLSEKRWVPLPE